MPSSALLGSGILAGARSPESWVVAACPGGSWGPRQCRSGPWGSQEFLSGHMALLSLRLLGGVTHTSRLGSGWGGGVGMDFASCCMQVASFGILA